jgi:hypothetical protein
MRRFDTILVTAISTLLWISICAAQQTPATSVPNLIRYSGTLKDVQGAALSSSTTVGVTFAIYEQQDGGAPVWQETQNVTPDASGQYSVVLGSTTSTGLPDDLFSQQEQRWLGVQVQGQAEQARVLLVSVPYAFKAHEAETLGGLPPSAFVKAPPTDAAGSTSVDTSTSVNALRIASGIDAASGSPPPPLSTVFNAPCPAGTVPSPNFVPLWFKPAVTVNVICNSVIFQKPIGPAGNVGIGTTTPSAKLDVNGPINSASDYRIGGNIVLATNCNYSNVSVGSLAGQGECSNVTVGNFAGASSSGNSNVAIGRLVGLTLGDDNVIIGDHASFPGAGNNNVIIGAGAAVIDGVGDNNTFVGANIDFNARFTSSDIFVGHDSGTQGAVTNDIYLDATCFPNCDLDHPENNTTRIGTQGRQTDTYIAGINGSPNGTSGSVQEVCVGSDGKIWGQTPGTTCMLSSRRFKENILDMDASSSKLFQLRPVTFFYKPQYDDGSHALQYGLIAEEVAKVYPDLVAYDRDGQPYTVKYQLLAPMLLNESQKQHAVVAAQQDVIKTQQQQIQAQGQQIADLQQRLSRLESLIVTK